MAKLFLGVGVKRGMIPFFSDQGVTFSGLSVTPPQKIWLRVSTKATLLQPLMEFLSGGTFQHFECFQPNEHFDRYDMDD